MRKFGKVQKKILLVFFGGVTLGFTHSPQQYFKTLRALRQEWREIDQRNFNRSLRRLSDEKLLEEKMLSDGSFKLMLTPEGERAAKELRILGNIIDFKKPKRWDGKWRLVLFDVPEKNHLFRDILREHLRNLKFMKLQHSVFISPYPFEKPISELVALYSAEPFVRVVTATSIDNEKTVRKFFKISAVS